MLDVRYDEPEREKLPNDDPQWPALAVFPRLTRRLGLRPVAVVLPHFLNRLLRRRPLLTPFCLLR
ncbi:MAG TPA: hypothetical protein VI700_01270 [Thermoanaerobaculaceae bacterium]|nr:hypothetical protein [Thermoanaerobaculaceae bacterium]